MKRINPKNVGALFFVALFIYGTCNKDNDDIVTPSGDQYLTWRIGTSSGSVSSPPDSVSMARQGNTTIFYGQNAANSANFYVSFSGTQAVGNYSASDFLIYANGKYYVQTSAPLQINVTTYGMAGQYIIGTYSGNIKDSTASAIVAVTGQIKVKNR
jgi:hypothetical protein